MFAALHALDTPDLPAFDSLARRLVVLQPDWSALVLADSNNHVVAAFPAGDGDDAVETPAAGWAKIAIATGQRLVSQLFELPQTSSGHFVMIAVPVVRDGRSRLRSARASDPTASARSFAQQQAPPNSAVALVDRNNRSSPGHRQKVLCRHDGERGVLRSDGDAGRRAAGRPYRARARRPTPPSAGRRHRPCSSRSPAARRSRRADARVAVDSRRRMGGDSGSRCRRRPAVRPGRRPRDARRRRARDGAGARRAGGARAVAHHRDRRARRPACGRRRDTRGAQPRARRGEPAEGRVPDDGLARAAHAADRDLRLGAAARDAGSCARRSGRARRRHRTQRQALSSSSTICSTCRASCPGKLRLDVAAVSTSATSSPPRSTRCARPRRQEHRARRRRSTSARARVAATPARLQQVIWNLLSNAVKFTPSGGRIDVEVARAATARSRSRSATPAPASPPSSCRTSSSDSARATPARRARTAVSGSGWRSSAISSSCTAARCAPRTTRRRRAPTFHVCAAGARPRSPCGRSRRSSWRARDAPHWRAARWRRRARRRRRSQRARAARAVLETAGAEVRAAASAEDALMILDTGRPTSCCRTSRCQARTATR